MFNFLNLSFKVKQNGESSDGLKKVVNEGPVKKESRKGKGFTITGRGRYDTNYERLNVISFKRSFRNLQRNYSLGKNDNNQ